VDRTVPSALVVFERPTSTLDAEPMYPPGGSVLVEDASVRLAKLLAAFAVNAELLRVLLQLLERVQRGLLVFQNLVILRL
jgi:hypothetical protein